MTELEMYIIASIGVSGLLLAAIVGITSVIATKKVEAKFSEWERKLREELGEEGGL